jgi:hypothetical protein
MRCSHNAWEQMYAFFMDGHPEEGTFQILR